MYKKLETIICRFCKSYDLPLPRRYKKCARKDYLAFAKSKKHSAKKIRKALRKQLGYVARDIRYTGTGRSDIPDKSKPELLQRTWHPFVRSKTWATGSECKSG